MALTIPQLAQIVSQAAAQKWCPAIENTMARYQINTPMRRAHFLAQVVYESGGFKWRTELASGEAYEGRADLGNTQIGDGKRYKGRGLIQLTGRANYAAYAKANSFKIDVLASPHLVADDDRLCADVAGWFWDRRTLNTLADKDDVEKITRRINGGLNGFEDRKKYLLKAKKALGIMA